MVQVLYLGGCTRSGSTLVDRALGHLPGFVSTGEFGLVTTHGIRDDRLCGCGRRFSECPFWGAVGQVAFGGWDSAESRELLALHPQVTRQRHLPLLLVPRASARFAATLRRYRELLGRLYAATAEVAGASVVVDSTKAPAFALALAGAPGVELRLAQLVRDSRGTAYSAGKRLQMQDSVDKVVMKDQYPPLVITARWVLYHSIFAAWRAVTRSGALVRYEDFVRDPRGVLTRMGKLVGRPATPAELGFVDPPYLALGTNHTTAGNDVRLVDGPVRLREDDEWRRRLPPRSRRLVTVASWPLLRRWGYLAPGAGSPVGEPR